MEHLENLDVGGRAILKWLFKLCSVRMWTALNWLNVGSKSRRWVFVNTEVKLRSRQKAETFLGELSNYCGFFRKDPAPLGYKIAIY
jgi:hypothetical protein